VFLGTPASGASQGAFNYALVLGDQGSNGGISQAGLYANPTYKTSADIWTGRSNMTFGGAFVQSGADVATAAPIATVATGGNLLDAATVTQASDGRGGYTVDVTFTLTDSQAGAFANGFDLLWGTGDCGNDAIFGTTGGGSPTPVPEPGTLAILGAGVLAALSLRCRARLVA
jgi:hypothetical protein